MSKIHKFSATFTFHTNNEGYAMGPLNMFTLIRNFKNFLAFTASYVCPVCNAFLSTPKLD